MTKLTMRNATDEQLNEYFETKVGHLVKYIKKFWNWKSLAPKGYKKYLSTYEDYQDMDTCKDQDVFTGLLDGSDMGNSFPVGCSLPYIAYDDTCQGRDPLTVLMQSCVSWGARLNKEIEKRKLEKNKVEVHRIITGQIEMSNLLLLQKYPNIAKEDLLEYVKSVEFGLSYIDR